VESFASYFNVDEYFRKQSKLQIKGSVYCCSSSNDIFAPAVKEKQGKSDFDIVFITLHNRPIIPIVNLTLMT